MYALSVCLNVPVRSEFYFSVFTGDQLWNERQVGDLCGGPAELKDDDEWDEVGQTGPLRGECVTAQTLVEDEGKGQHDAHSTWMTKNNFLSVICRFFLQLQMVLYI